MSAFQQGLSELADGGNLRRAALLLHSVGPSDQAWLLERISGSQRQRLRAMLDELRALGVPAEAAVPDVDAPIQAQQKSAAAKAALSPTERVAAAEAGSVVAVLRNEPPALVAILLQAHDWPWREQVLGHFPGASRQLGSRTRQSTPAKLAEVVIARVADRMQQPQRAAAPLDGGSSWQRLTTALRALLGRPS